VDFSDPIVLVVDHWPEFQRADSIEADRRAVQPFLWAWKKAAAKGWNSMLQAARGRAALTTCWSVMGAT